MEPQHIENPAAAGASRVKVHGGDQGKAPGFKRPSKSSQVSKLYVRTAMANRPSYIWTIEELCEATECPARAVAVALADLVVEGVVERARAYQCRVDVTGRGNKKVWMLRKKEESDRVLQARWEKLIEGVRAENARLVDMIDWVRAEVSA